MIDYMFGEKQKKVYIIISVAINFVLLTAVVLLTCLVFTSGSSDGKIGVNVISGECNIDILDTEGKSIVGDVFDFVASDKKDEIQFYPGAVYHTEGFKVKNIGTIPVNYCVYISEDEKTDKKTFEEAFELWITKDTSNLENAESLTSFTGHLDVSDESEIYYLVVKMKESAGNEFQNKTYTGIGVTVYAVQGNVDIGE